MYSQTLGKLTIFWKQDFIELKLHWWSCCSMLPQKLTKFWQVISLKWSGDIHLVPPVENPESPKFDPWQLNKLKCIIGCSLIQPQQSNTEHFGQVLTHHSNLIQLRILILNVVQRIIISLECKWPYFWSLILIHEWFTTPKI